MHNREGEVKLQSRLPKHSAHLDSYYVKINIMYVMYVDPVHMIREASVEVSGGGHLFNSVRFFNNFRNKPGH